MAEVLAVKCVVLYDLAFGFFHNITLLLFITTLHGMQTRSSDENSVCLSVKCVHCDKTEERSVQEKKNGWWGRRLLPEILG